jgi:hypothetical protein
MRPQFATSLLCFSVVAFAIPGAASAAGNPGDEISKFLKQVTDDRLPIAIYGLDITKPVTPGASRPPKDVLLQAANWPLTLTSKCSVEARGALKKAIAAAPLSAAQPFRPDYCMVYQEPEGVTKVLWIDSAPGELQMRLYVTGSLGPIDISGIQTPTSGGGDVHVALEGFVRVAREPFQSMRNLVVTIGQSPLPLELYSIDPKQVEDVFGKKHWNILGKVPIAANSLDWVHAYGALDLALDKDAMPAYTAHDFKPRLAVSTWFPDRSGTHYLLLMSFDCRLAELYVNDNLQGCVGISNRWSQGTIQRAGSKVPLALVPDQTLNDILVANGKPLRAKATSSSN